VRGRRSPWFGSDPIAGRRQRTVESIAPEWSWPTRRPRSKTRRHRVPGRVARRLRERLVQWSYSLPSLMVRPADFRRRRGGACSTISRCNGAARERSDPSLLCSVAKFASATPQLQGLVLERHCRGGRGHVIACPSMSQMGGVSPESSCRVPGSGGYSARGSARDPAATDSW